MMIYKKIHGRNNSWFFIIRYKDLRDGLEMWTIRSKEWKYFKEIQGISLETILNNQDHYVEITETEAKKIIEQY